MKLFEKFTIGRNDNEITAEGYLLNMIQLAFHDAADLNEQKGCTAIAEMYRGFARYFFKELEAQGLYEED